LVLAAACDHLELRDRTLELGAPVDPREELVVLQRLEVVCGAFGARAEALDWVLYENLRE